MNQYINVIYPWAHIVLLSFLYSCLVIIWMKRENTSREIALDKAEDLIRRMEKLQKIHTSENA